MQVHDSDPAGTAEEESQARTSALTTFEQECPPRCESSSRVGHGQQSWFIGSTCAEKTRRVVTQPLPACV